MCPPLPGLAHLESHGLCCGIHMVGSPTQPLKCEGGLWLMMAGTFCQHFGGPCFPTKLATGHLGNDLSMYLLLQSFISSAEYAGAAVFVCVGLGDFSKEPSSDCCLGKSFIICSFYSGLFKVEIAFLCLLITKLIHAHCKN